MLRRRSICIWLVSLLTCSVAFGGTQALWLCLHEQVMTHIVSREAALEKCASASDALGAASEMQNDVAAQDADSTNCTDIQLTDDSSRQLADQQIQVPIPVLFALFSILMPEVVSEGKPVPAFISSRAPPTQLHAALSVADSVVFRL